MDRAAFVLMAAPAAVMLLPVVQAALLVSLCCAIYWMLRQSDSPPGALETADALRRSKTALGELEPARSFQPAFLIVVPSNAVPAHNASGEQRQRPSSRLHS
jgi:hypothetical protein